MEGESMNAFHRLHALRMENDAVKFSMDEMRPRFDRLRDRHTNGAAPVAVSAYQLFQTPPAIAERLVALLDLKPGSRVLEPSAGLGRILDALPKDCQTVAVEMAADCAKELFKREDITLKQRDFLTLGRADLGTFDAVGMNPPFHMRADIEHIRHALKFLKPGGRLAAICMDTPHREKALRSMSATWETLPPGTFRSEGTGVGCILLSIHV